MAAFSPSCASDMISLVPRRPRSAGLEPLGVATDHLGGAPSASLHDRRQLDSKAHHVNRRLRWIEAAVHADVLGHWGIHITVLHTEVSTAQLTPTGTGCPSSS